MLKMTSTDDYNFDPLIKILAKSYKSGLKDAGPDEINGAIRFVHETVKSINSLIDRGDTRKIQKSLVNLAYGLGLVFKDSPDEKQFVSLVNAGLIRVFKNVDRIAKTVNLSKHKYIILWTNIWRKRNLVKRHFQTYLMKLHNMCTAEVQLLDTNHNLLLRVPASH